MSVMISESELATIAGDNPENSVIQRLVEGYRYACQNLKAELRLEVLSEVDKSLVDERNRLIGHLALEKTTLENAKFELSQMRDRLRSAQLECIALMQSRVIDLEKMNGELREEIMKVRSIYNELNTIVQDYRRRYG